MPAYRVKVSVIVEAYDRQYTTLESSSVAVVVNADDAQQAHGKATGAIRGGLFPVSLTVDSHERKRAEVLAQERETTAKIIEPAP